MARAKRTARAEARRRSRAAQSLDETEGAELSEATDEPAPRRQSSSQAQKSTAQPARMGFMVAFRAAIHPIHVREDLASLPWIATHSKALWIPLLITVLSTVAIIATSGGDLSLFMFAYFIQTPAIGGVFIAGFLAPRASWLLGAIVGLVAAACYTLLLLSYPSTIYAGLPPTQSQAVEVRRVGVRPVAGDRRDLRRRRGLVPALPALVGSRSEQADHGAEVEARRRPDAVERHVPEGRRPPLTLGPVVGCGRPTTAFGTAICRDRQTPVAQDASCIA